MKNLALAICCLALGALGGFGVQRYLDTTNENTVTEREVLYWVAPMDAGYRRDTPGKSPMGMDLIPVYVDKGRQQDDSLVRISPLIENNLGVRTAAVERSPMKPEIETVGYVQFDEDTIHHIHTRVEGWIEQLSVAAVGDSVIEGEVLFKLYSPTLLNAQQEYVAALKSANQPLIAASRERLLLLGLGHGQLDQLAETRQVDKTVDYMSPMSGIVSMLNVRHGMFVDPSTEVMAIGQLDSVWVIGEVFERQLAWVKTGQEVVMTVDSYPGQLWHGTLDMIYPELDPRSRTARVRIRFANKDGKLKPNMFANLKIAAGDKQQRLHIPRSALIRGGHHDRVVVALGDGSFRSVVVRAGIEAGNRSEILQGLVEGDQVVSSAQFLIDSESNIAAESERLGESGAELEENKALRNNHRGGARQ